ncbi:MAG: GTPase ObgE [Bacilli bacterium]|nr:GTPase ObgE [Bacillales bacterium]MDY2574452.1 GTPase ObgE [Bacilli bacterium]
MFIDKAKITLKAGKGGDGAISFLHEKFIEKGGPDGGNGGRGGSIYFKATNDETTLINYRHARKVSANDGGKGEKKKMYGRKAEDVYLNVPVGTVIFQEPEHTFLADLSKEGQIYLGAKGGRGGRGNACFVSPTNRVPRVSENGLPGEEKTLTLELKLLADVGLVGLPSVGKSTLLSVVSAAKPEIGDYPFTTLSPNLGVCKVGDSSFVMADLPGLIKGASQGKGLGLVFLRHIERCRVLVHILDMYSEDPLNDFKVINNELGEYGYNLLKRKMIVVCSKVEDVETTRKYLEVKKALEGQYEVLPICAILHEGIDELLYKIKETLDVAPSFPLYEEKDQEIKVYDAKKNLKPEFEIKKISQNEYRIYGERIERTYSLINVSTDEGVMKLLSVLRNIGVDEKLHELGAKDGDNVYLCDFEFEYFE